MLKRLVRLLGMLAIGLMAVPLPTAAQSTTKVWRIGYLYGGACAQLFVMSFVQALREFGYIDRQNLVIEYRCAAGRNDRLSTLASELIGLGVDLIVTGATPATLAAMQATRTIPIVFEVVDPVEKGIVTNLARPGGNLTGLALITDMAKPLELLKEAAPGITRVAFLYDPAVRSGAYLEIFLGTLLEHARSLDIAVQAVALRDPDETERVIEGLVAGTDGLLIDNSGINLLARDRLCALAAQRRLPTAGALREVAQAGCLMSYGENLVDIYRRIAGYVDRILKGARPADLPVQVPTKFELVVNLNAAKALGLTVPPSIILRTDKVIE
jgi:putative tryptophan/tyrosine transport system substrate-binding protein